MFSSLFLLIRGTERARRVRGEESSKVCAAFMFLAFPLSKIGSYLDVHLFAVGPHGDSPAPAAELPASRTISTSIYCFFTLFGFFFISGVINHLRDKHSDPNRRYGCVPSAEGILLTDIFVLHSVGFHHDETYTPEVCYCLQRNA